MRDYRQWSRLVCRAWSSLYLRGELRDVPGLDYSLCGLVYRNGRHRQRWEPVLAGMKGNWVACALRGDTQ